MQNPAYIETIEYPETDGKPMAETDVHIRLLTDLRFSLEIFFRHDPHVYVSGNLMMYYVEGQPQLSISPDVFVVRGVPKGQRRTYKTWAEGHAPQLVIELASKSTWRHDLFGKVRIYEKLGVQEYFVFDPEYLYLTEALLGFRLENGELTALQPAGKCFDSLVLGLELVDTGETLRLRDPQHGEFLLTTAEEAEAHRREAAARIKAEAEVARLREELEQLKKQS